MDLNYDNITLSGKIAVGKSTLTKNLVDALGWNYVSAGAIQREYDREHGKNEHKIGAAQRSDEHEREIDAMTKKMLKEKKNIIYEAWLAGFMAQDIPRILKVLVVCSDYGVRVDRVVNREKISVDEAKAWMKQREEENIPTWQRLYGNHDFWDHKYYDLVIDTFSTGPVESLNMVLEKLGYKK